MVERGAMGFKAFMCPSGIDEFPACDRRTLREGMERIADLDSILLVHAEDPSLLREPEGPTAVDYLRSRPEESEIAAIETAIELAARTACRLHIVHVSTERGADLITKAARYEVDVTGETCPHYLLYTSDDVERVGGIAKCAPPFRSSLMTVLPIVVSDHSPSTMDLKEGDDFRKIWGGISGCQSTRQLLLGELGLELSAVASVTATNVATRFRIPNKGDIAPGFDADLWIVDLTRHDVVRAEDLRYKNRFSVHEGMRIRGLTVQTIARGGFIRPGAR